MREQPIITALSSLPRWQRKRDAGYRIDNRVSFCAVSHRDADGNLLPCETARILDLLTAAGYVVNVSGGVVVVCERRPERGGKS